MQNQYMSFPVPALSGDSIANINCQTEPVRERGLCKPLSLTGWKLFIQIDTV